MWTKSQKLSAAVLGLAVTAFVVDRFVLAPAGDEAEDTASLVVSRPSAPAPAAGAAKGPGQPTNGAAAASSTVTLASRLASIGESRRFAHEVAGDAFRPAQAWVVAWSPKPAAPKVETAAKSRA